MLNLGLRKPAMTLIEMAITIFMVSIALFFLTGWLADVRNAAKEDLATRMLTDLDEALARYRKATGHYPTLRGPTSAIPAIVDLLDHKRTRPILEAFPQALWKGPKGHSLVDPWGTPLRYLSPESEDPIVVANSGRPVFISAGADRDFGDTNPAALGDNRRSDDPGPDDFYDAVRNALVGGDNTEGTTEGDEKAKEDDQ